MLLASLLAQVACAFSPSDYGGTAYTCPTGECPTGFGCIDGICREPGWSADAGPGAADAQTADADPHDANPCSGAADSPSQCEACAAQQPENDTCAQALDLTAAVAGGGGSFRIYGNSDGYALNVEGQVPCTGGVVAGGGPDAFYQIAVAEPGKTLTARLDAYGGWDSSLFVFSGECAALSCVDADDRGNTTGEIVQIAATEGETYFIVVDAMLVLSGCYSLQVEVTTE